ncbi:MAG: GGDEF domain-containing protein [Myxococcota bacterium]
MGWFSRNTDNDVEVTLLRDALLHTLDLMRVSAEGTRRARIERLLVRLERPPVPTGLMRELESLGAAPPSRAGGGERHDTGVYGTAMRAMAETMMLASLIDEGLQQHLHAAIKSIPWQPRVADAQRISGRMEELRRIARPVRERAMAERRELVRLAGALSNALGDAKDAGRSLGSGLDALAIRLRQNHDPEVLRQLRLDAMRDVENLREETDALNAALLRSRQEVDALHAVVERQNEVLQQVTAELARDPMTNLYNRAAFDASFEELIRSTRSDRVPLALILIDIDHFKHINDTWGHPTGDEVIKNVAARLSRLLRANSDVVARIGGEEFAALLPKIGEERTRKIAERVRADIEKMCFSAEGTTFRVTISLGVGVLLGNESAPAFYRRIDKALYRAKNNGRNRVSAA